MYLTLLALPLSTFLCLSLFGRFLGPRGCILLSGFSSISCMLISMVIFYEVALNQSPCHISLCSFFHSELYDANWGFLFDTLTAVMCLVVTLVSCLVVLFSFSYMIQDPHFIRFISYLKLFTVAMLILVTADNLIQLFVGWEGVGLASFLLISFWYTRLQASKAAIQAMMLNRIGDVGLALGIMTLFYAFQTTNYEALFAIASVLESKAHMTILTTKFDLLNFACVMLFIGAVGKSGQFGLHAWLPEAMNAPTPVSALLHAATMVTAGVFLLARVSPLLEYAPEAAATVTIVGAITCLFAGTIGLVQNDLKRIIAYSTCSQLGYMVTACGASNYSLGIFHLFNHAFFKALLFLSAGAMIHALANEQDIRKYGGFQKILLFSYTLVLIGSLALIGTPFLTGFYSKDVILELAGARYSLSVHFSYLLASFSVLTTSYYSWRLIFFCFHTNPLHNQIGRYSNSQKQTVSHAMDADWVMALPLIILALGSIYSGFLFKSMFIGLGTDFWNNAIYVKPSHSHLIEAEFLSLSVKLLPLGLTISGGLLAYLFTLVWVERSYSLASGPFRKVYMWLNRRWLYDKLLNDMFAMPSYRFGFALVKIFDKGLLELLPFVSLGLSFKVKDSSTKLGHTQSGLIFHYALIMITASVCFFALLAMADQQINLDSRLLGLMFLAALTFF